MIFFAVVASVAVVTAVATIAARNSVHSALFLVVNFFCLALLYLSLNAEFLAAAQIVVYAGAIVVLFLFVITLLNPGHEESTDRLPAQRPFALAFGLALLVEVALLLRDDSVLRRLGDFPAAAPLARQFSGSVGAVQPQGNTQAVGLELFSAYALPFEVTSVLLLMALIGAVFLAKRQLR